jgi:hypothetical protein
MYILCPKMYFGFFPSIPAGFEIHEAMALAVGTFLMADYIRVQDSHGP